MHAPAFSVHSPPPLRSAASLPRPVFSSQTSLYPRPTFSQTLVAHLPQDLSSRLSSAPFRSPTQALTPPRRCSQPALLLAPCSFSLESHTAAEAGGIGLERPALDDLGTIFSRMEGGHMTEPVQAAASWSPSPRQSPTLAATIASTRRAPAEPVLPPRFGVGAVVPPTLSTLLARLFPLSWIHPRWIPICDLLIASPFAIDDVLSSGGLCPRHGRA